VRIDPELLFEDAERAIALAVELGGRVVVVEDQGLTGAGLLLGQRASEGATASIRAS
jgi:sugar phosphate isomerase/epimerase